MTANPTVFVVDDDPAVRDSLAEMGAVMGLPVEVFECGEEFLEAIDPGRPGCLLLDLRMPGMSGIELQERLLSNGVQIPIIFLTGHGDVSVSVQAMKKGAMDFFEKPYRPEELARSVRDALALDAQRRQEQSQHDAAALRIAKLTPQEQQVMERMVAGKSNKLIASELEVSLRTVEYRRAALFKKLEVDSKPQLVAMALAARSP